MALSDISNKKEDSNSLVSRFVKFDEEKIEDAKD